MPDQAISQKMSMDVTLTTLIAAVAGVLGAFAFFRPKFAISRAMKRETGSVEPAFRAFYDFPHRLSFAIIIVICLLLLAAFVYSVRPDVIAHNKLLADFAAFFVISNLVWIFFLAGVAGAIVRLNLIPWALLGISGFALRSPFGPHGQSAGWLQAWNVCRAGDKGQPLLLSSPDLERLADVVLDRLANASIGTAFAQTPTAATIEARANIALFGCILEATHYAQRWQAPSWTQFYAALATIHDQTNIFSPEEIQKFASGSAFADRVRQALAAELGSRSEPVPADRYLAAADHLVTTWVILRRHSGCVLNLAPSYELLRGSRLFWLDRRLAKLPMLNSDGMRPQLIKLLARWGTIPWAKSALFLQPFAKRQGWLLLQENALRVFSKQKDVTFFDVGDVQLTRIACLQIFSSLERKVRRRHSAEAQGVDKAYPLQWDLFAAADFTLWELASQAMTQGQADNWDSKKGWRWKFEGGRASKLS